MHEEFKEQKSETDYSQLFSQLIREQDNSQVSNTGSPSKIVKVKNKGRKLPSTYDPDSQNRNLARYCSCIQEESILAINTKVKFRDNITVEHRKALNSLKKKIEEKQIIITLADKGSGIVVLDYDKYIEKGTYYIEQEAKAYTITQKTQKLIVADIVKERNKIVKKLKEHKVIEVDTATYCMKQIDEKITGMKFYYKVHKDTNIDTMPLRPLQSCIGAPTQHLSQVLTDLLQPLLTEEFIPTFIQDSNQLLFRLSKLDQLNTNSTLISSDVAALYPSIPHKEGLEAVSSFLVEFTEYNDNQITYIMKALELVITQNYVMWNSNIYTQDSGVAMGTPVAVAYANIFMHWIDTQLGRQADYIIEHIRYIDDNLFIIPQDKIEDLMLIANSILTYYISS